jgi:peroxiredoxin
VAKEEIFSLEANLTNIPDSTLFKIQDMSNVMIDSAYVIDGKLSLKGVLNNQHPEKLFLSAMIQESQEFIYTMLLVGNETINFKADKKDFPWNINATGSIHQDEAEKFNHINFQKQEIIKELRQKFSSDEVLLAQKISTVSDSLDNATIDLIKANFNNYAALNSFKYHKTKFSNEELSKLYDDLDQELKETDAGKAVKLQSEYPLPKVGGEYYDYSAINQFGDSLALSQVEEKYILLHFSSSACYGSQLSLPELKGIHQEHESDLEIISISTDISKEQWQNTVKTDSIPWNYLWDGKGDFSEAVIKYWEVGTPNYVLISPEKVILDKWYGYRTGIFDEKLGKYFQ